PPERLQKTLSLRARQSIFARTIQAERRLARFTCAAFASTSMKPGRGKEEWFGSISASGDQHRLWALCFISEARRSAPGATEFDSKPSQPEPVDICRNCATAVR